MDLDAVALAGERLEWAEDALTQLRGAQDFPSSEKAWTALLLAASAFYSKLEQGSKAKGKSTAWFGRKKKQRKDDPVLRYIHFARNSDEHGIERVTDRRNAGWLDVGFGEQRKTHIQKVDPVTNLPTGPEIRAFLYGQHLVAVTAHDRRFGDSCDPPIGLIGDDLDGSHPPDIAAVVLEKLRDILEEAGELV